ncbi:hypothetical protein F4780DRAFT_776904 [Xylariomycetidae sp. FL0641]|nr:hypothetical protein F4780DRAFT_776904 [Xylariomycetidae sp. FL0641]
MVYCGKPSRGCQMCRTRRIKCDETKPTCNQCAKSRRQCPGYKDEFDLVFRNETKATERRAQKANRKALAQKGGRPEIPSTEPTEPSVSMVLPDNAKSPLEQSILPALNVPVEQRASCQFVSNFVLLPRGSSTTRGFLDFLIPLLKQETPHDPLKYAFGAVSMAFMNNRSGTPSDLTDKAISDYTQALKSVNRAIQDPEAQKADSTLAAVLLLGMFESITAQKIGMLNWGSHTEGAIQLVKARGRKQLRTKTGWQLFIAIRTQMIIHSLTSGTAPIMGAEWWLADTVKDSTASLVQRHMIKASELRAEVTRMMVSMARTPDNAEIMLEMIRKAQTLDQEIVTWMKNVPEHYKFETVAWEDHVPNGDYSKAEVFPGRVDLYRDFWISSLWNSARTTRLILASLIVRCAAWVCSPVDYRTTPEYATAARTCVETITDVIASVPYNLGWHLNKKHILQKANLSGFACGEDDHQKGLAGYFLCWPLTCINGQDYLTDAQRAWTIGRLKYIGYELGVKYGIVLSGLNVRIPSMLIRRDGLMASPYGTGTDLEKILRARDEAPPTAGYALNPLQQREAMQKQQFEQDRAALIARAAGGLDGKASKNTQWVAQRWLTV